MNEVIRKRIKKVSTVLILLSLSITCLTFYNWSAAGTLDSVQLPPIPPSPTSSSESTNSQQQFDVMPNNTQVQQNITDTLSNQQQLQQQPLPLPSTETLNSSEIVFETYKNPQFGISIEYPKNWRISEVPGPVQIVSFSSPLENLTDNIPRQLTISRTDYLQNITQNNYTSMILNNLQSQGINAAASDAVLSNRTSHQMITSFSGNGLLPLQEILQIWSVKDNTVYTIEYTAGPDKFFKYLPVIDEMTSSFKVKGWD